MWNAWRIGIVHDPNTHSTSSGALMRGVGSDGFAVLAGRFVLQRLHTGVTNVTASYS